MKRPRTLLPRRAVLAFCLPPFAAACGQRPATAPTSAFPDGTICAPDCVPAQGRIERRPVLSLTDHGGLGSPYDHTGVPAFILKTRSYGMQTEAWGVTASALALAPGSVQVSSSVCVAMSTT